MGRKKGYGQCSKDVWMQGCVDARMCGCKDVWMQGCVERITVSVARENHLGL